MSDKKSNHLIHETSPYLLQHAYNPVDWHPWGEEALKKAREENKPILLSIGYAACHWCHVMAHESFEDQATADIMNQLFINIKVDREERPDLDKIYQTSHYLLTKQSGGWPLTVFLTPDDLTPFFSGTYFPLTRKYQLPAFKEILHMIATVYRERKADITQQNAELMKILHYLPPVISDVRLNDQPIIFALQRLQDAFDTENGGFFGAPKFPHPSILEFLLRSEVNLALQMVMTTLIHMGEGGIFDQVGGGFYRYTVDAKWEIPHFEKMLYDNGQLLYLYSLAARNHQEIFFADIARRTATWILSDMQSSQGGYFSSMDADSEGEEGKFYLWNKNEIKNNLTKDEYDLIQLYFGLDEPPNVDEKWHVHVANRITTVANKLNISLEDAKKRLISAQQKLLMERNKRIHPGRDEKILTSWNGLMIKGMMMAGDVLQEPSFITSAHQSIDFIKQNLWVNNTLLATYKNDRAHLNAYLDDYAFLLDALLTSLQVNWNNNYLFFAIDLANALLTNFNDEMQGGFYFTSHNHEKLLYRPKTMMDEAIPSGNGVLVRALLLLGHLLGETKYLNAALKTLQAAWPTLSQMPIEHANLLLGLRDFLNPPQIIILRGNLDAIKPWQMLAKSMNKNIFAISATENNLPESIATKKALGEVCAYICEGMKCKAVIQTIEEFKVMISN